MGIRGDNMARKTQISKEVILEAALKMLIRDGYAAININEYSNASEPPFYRLRATSDFNT